MKSWQVFNAARKSLKSKMFAIFGNRTSRMIDYWAQDPAFSAEHKRNPIDRLVMLLRELDQNGMRQVAVSALRLLANAINCKVIDRNEVVPDKETLYEEILDDMPCLLAYQSALMGTDLEEVDRTKAELDREMAENRVRFVEKNNL